MVTVIATGPLKVATPVLKTNVICAPFEMVVGVVKLMVPIWVYPVPVFH